MDSRIEIEEKVLDGEQVGPVTVAIDENGIVGEVSIEDRLLDGTGTDIIVEVSDSLGVVGVEELVEVKHEIDTAKTQAEESANKAASLINDAEQARLQLERDVEQIKDLTDQSTKNAAVSTNKAAEATQQAGIATSQADKALHEQEEATKQAGIATTQADAAKTAQSIATTKRDEAVTAAQTATSMKQAAEAQAANASSSAKRAEQAANTAATNTKNEIRSEMDTKVVEATKQAGIATTQATNAESSANLASQQAGQAIAQATEAKKQAGIATTQAGRSVSYANASEASKTVSTQQASIATTQANTATAQQKEATKQAGIATTQANNAASSASNSYSYIDISKKAGEKAVQDKFNALEPTMDSKVSAATTQANLASQRATAAGASATEAARQVGLAKNEVTAAQGEFSKAQKEATKAANSATTAGQQAGIATTQAQASSTSASTSASHETKALQYRNEAEGFKNQANTAKDTATSQAGNSSRSAVTSTQQADRAKTEADRAKNIADTIGDISGGKFGVTSINGQVGIIENFDYSDVNAKPASYIPSWGELSGKPDLFTESEADAKYLPKTGKAVSAGIADRALALYSGTTFPGHDWSKVPEEERKPYGKWWTNQGRTNLVINLARPSDFAAEGCPITNAAYCQLITYHNWSDSSGGLAYQEIKFGNRRIQRTGSATAGWSTTWVELYTTEHKPTAADVGARPASYVPSWGEVTGKPNVAVQRYHASFTGLDVGSLKDNVDAEVFLHETASKAHGAIFRYTGATSNNVQLLSKSSGVTHLLLDADREGNSVNIVPELKEKGQRVYSPNNKPSIDDINPVKTVTKNISMNADTWADALGNIDIPASGVYQVYIYYDSTSYGGHAYQQHYTGQFYWYSGGTNSVNTSEIIMHHMGHADNNEILYARTMTKMGNKGDQTLQVRCDSKLTNCPFTFKLRRIM